MARLWPRLPAVLLGLLWLAAADALTPLCPAAHAQQPAYSGSKSWTDAIVSPFKQGFNKMGRALSPKTPAPQPSPQDDAVSLSGKGKPGAELYVALARLYEQSGKTAEAEQQYRLALEVKPDDLTALLGCAQLKERLGKPDEAVQFYRRAATSHPRQASVHNNMGLCYARQNRLDEAAAALGQAVDLEPKNRLYRNNIATVLVDRGKLPEAFAHLRAVHNDAAAYYNMGYLLNKKGQPQQAIQYFSMALQADPSMDAARRWADHLRKTAAQARLQEHPIGAGVRVASRPTVRQENAFVPPDEAAMRRLPPTAVRQPAFDGATLPGIAYERSAVPAAPLPPPISAALRPLPRVN